jgi:uncharacterized protein YgiM (DUF1202 family)
MDTMNPRKFRRPVIQAASTLPTDKELQPEQKNRKVTNEITDDAFPKSAIVAVPAANMRARPTTESIIVAKLTAGDRVSIILQDKGWYLVRLPSDRLAWAYQGLFRGQERQVGQPLAMSEPKPENAPGFEAIKRSPKGGVVGVSVANLRARPTTESPILDQLRAGVRVTLLLQENDWYMVRLPDDRLAWGHQSLFRNETNPPESMEPKQVAEKPVNAERS